MFRIDTDRSFTGPRSFDMRRFFEVTDDGVSDIRSSAFLEALRDLDPDGQFTVTVEGKRPELISYKIYGTTQLWWIILYYNNLTSYRQIVSGQVLQYPSRIDLDSIKNKAAIDTRTANPENLRDWYIRNRR